MAGLLALPLFLLGGGPAVRDLFKAKRPTGKPQAGPGPWALWWPLLFLLLFIFLPRRRSLNAPILLGSIGLGLITGVTEEILWRGVYQRLFPGNLWLNTIYPTHGFAAWHLAPQRTCPNALPGGVVSFLGYTLALGLTYAYHARQTGSIRGCTLSHMAHDSLGLGARIYLA